MSTNILLSLHFGMSLASNRELDKLFKDYYDWKRRAYPEWGGYNNLLEDFSDEGVKQKKEACKRFYERSQKLKWDTTEYQIYLLVLQSEINPCVRNHSWGKYFAPITHLDGVQNTAPFLIPYIENKQDFHDGITTLRGIPKMIEQIIHQLKEGVKRKITHAKESLKGIDQQIQQISYEDFIEPFSDAKKFGNVKIAKKIINSGVIPAFKNLYNYINNTYSKNLRPKPGLSSNSHGKEIYQEILYYYLGINITAEEVHKIGLEEVSYITKQSKSLIKRLGHNRTIKCDTCNEVSDTKLTNILL